MEKLTFNLRAPNGNYYRGTKPCNAITNCWAGDVKEALILTLAEARLLIKTNMYCSGCTIVVAGSNKGPNDVKKFFKPC